MNNTFPERKSRAQVGAQADGAAGVTLEALRRFRYIEVPLMAELDRRSITVRELLTLAVGDLLPLSRPVGENIDLMAGDALLANAEILALDDKLAVRVADISNKEPAFSNRRESLVPAAAPGGVARE